MLFSQNSREFIQELTKTLAMDGAMSSARSPAAISKPNPQQFLMENKQPDVHVTLDQLFHSPPSLIRKSRNLFSKKLMKNKIN